MGGKFLQPRSPLESSSKGSQGTGGPKALGRRCVGSAPPAMNDDADAAVAVNDDKHSGCGGDAVVPPRGGASGGVSVLAERVEAMEVDATSEGARPRDDTRRAPLGCVSNESLHVP